MRRIRLWLALIIQECREAYCAWFGHDLSDDAMEVYESSAWAKGPVCTRCKRRCALMR